MNDMLNTLSQQLTQHTEELTLIRQLNWIAKDKSDQLQDLLLSHLHMTWRANSKNPLERYGRKCYSQNDEDGITLEILRRLNLEKGTFAEYGVGNGLENNTLLLAGMGWRGFWVGGEELKFDYTKSSRLRYFRDWITLDNISAITQAGMDYLGTATPDVVSLDLDGNDYHFIQRLLSDGLAPALFIAEYNARFVPPTKFIMPYDPKHCWDGSDYFGVALTDLAALFKHFGYRLICCNAQTGSNAFFIREQDAALFSDVPQNITDLYVEPRFYLQSRYGHPHSPKTVEVLFS